MGTCVICGTATDGRVCESHAEDVAFEFRGNHPGQLERNRYYRGEVDGFADFGVFVDVGESVTGLLHRSEIDGRLESLDWEPGDEVYVQVLDVHDNGNVDLGWSIRQSAREFRHNLVHDPDADESEFEASESAHEASEDAGERGPGTTEGPVGRRDPGAADRGPTEGDAATDAADAASAGSGAADSEATGTETGAEAGAAPDEGESDATGSAVDDGTPVADAERAAEDTTPAPAAQVPVEDLADLVGERVRLEGEVTSVRQTGGPTIFEVTDETGSVDCAAFVAAGERAYPDVDAGAVVAVEGVVERHRGELQVETESLDVLSGEEREAVVGRLAAALDEQAAPPGEELLAEDSSLEAVREDLVETATELRRAVLDGRPVVVRHAASVDGYVAGAALERALLDLVREVHAAADAEYHYLERRPLTEDSYDLSAATDDVTDMLDAEARHGEARPLVAFAAAGETAESVDGFDLLDVYDVDRLVVAAGEPDDAVRDAVDVAVGVEDRSAATVAATVAALAEPDVADDLAHLPAVSYWADAPATYADLAADRGYDADDVRDLREALALQAYFQSWEAKREPVRDLLWGDETDLAGDVAAQFRDRLDDELRTATPHLERHEVDGVGVRVLDVEAYTHQYDFPPTAVLLDALHRRAEDDAVATVGVGGDDLRLRAGSELDVRAVAEALAERLPEAGVRLRNGRRGRVEFLRGEREAVLDAVVPVVGSQLAEEPVRATTDGSGDGSQA
ncbi:MAG: OB-fold nucleic acid binding domain-containing protein [Halobacteriaceae archaeon]